MIDGYSELYPFDRNRNRGRVLIYIFEDIPNKLLENHKLQHDTEGIFIELNLKNQMSIYFIKLRK